jgi:uracil-DNA glycosylase family 4
MNDHQRNVEQHALSLGLDPQVLCSGSPSSQIVIIAEYPGETEVQLKQPLVGASGRYLWTELGKIGVKREQTYITNVIKRKTETNLQGLVKVPAEERRKWEAVLWKELSVLANARYILCMGNTALQAVTGHTGVKKWRGSVLNFVPEMGYRNAGQVLVTYNPAFVLRDPAVELHFKIDIKRLSRVLGGTYRPHVISPIINPSKRDVLDYLRKLRADRLPVSFDIETAGGETACIGFAASAHEGICVNFRTADNTSRFDTHDEATIRLAIAEMFADRAMYFVAQNGNFDAYWLRYKDRLRVRVHYDTLLAHHTLYPTLPHSLAFLTTQYTEHPYYKDDAVEWRAVGDIDTYWRYNVTDCCITRAVYSRTIEELRQQNLEKFFFDHVMRLQPHLVEMTTNGILIDTHLRDAIKIELVGQLDELERSFLHSARVATGDPELDINPRSSVQLRELFFERLRFVGRGTSTDEDNRNRIRVHPNTSQASREMLSALDKYKEEHKFFSTYVDTVLDSDGKMRCEYKQWGTQNAPGRLSSASVMWGSGTNLQNQPERARAMFIAPPGYGLVYFDLSQAEARYVAYAWQISALIENFALAATDPDRYDVHRLNAARIFQRPYDEIPKTDWDENHKPTLRYQGKRSVHGFNYRLMPDSAAIKFGVSLAEATHAHRLYHAAFPEIARAWQDIRKRVERDKVLYNAYGRRWILLSRIDSDEALTPIIAFEPQSSIGDKVCEVIYLSHEDPEWPRSSNGLEAAITLNIHDALVALARLDDMARVARVLHRHATRPIIVRNQELVIPAEIGLSQPDASGTHRWSTIKKVKLEDLSP